MLAERVLRASRGALRHVVVAGRLVSTQDTAAALLDQVLTEEIALETTLIVAASQTLGHGRSGREWVSPPGGLYLTWVRSCRPGVSPEAVPMLAGAAAVRAADALAPGLVSLKWPNDLLIAGGKAGGVLVTARRGDRPWVAVGFGLNLSSVPSLPGDGGPGAACLADHAPVPRWEEALPVAAGTFAAEMESLLESPGEGVGIWKERLVHCEGDRILVRLADGSAVEGTFAGLTEEGYLRLGTRDGVRTIASGEIVHWSE